MKKSFNRRALRLLTILAVLSGAVIVALFFFVAQNQIRERATETLRAFAADPGGAWDEISGKPLKTRGSGTRAVAGILCLLLGPCQGSMGGGGCERPQWSQV